MVLIRQKITIINIRKSAKTNVNQELQLFGNALGLFNLRDKDKSCFRIFVELLKAAKAKKQLTSDEIAASLNLSRGTVIHHLKRLMESGIVIAEKNKYILRVDNLSSLVGEIEKDIKRTLDDLMEIAEDIDRWVGL